MVDQDANKLGAPVAEKPAAAEIADPLEKTVIKTEEEISEATPRRVQHTLPYVVIVDGPRTGGRFSLKDGANIIGRAPGNEIRLDDQSVSRQHAEISRTDSGWFIKDLGSKNGTLVNAHPISDSVGIGHKDVIKTGIYLLRLITKETSLEEELTLPPELSMADRTVFVAAPPDGMTASLNERDIPAPEMASSDEAPLDEGGGAMDEEPSSEPGRRFRLPFRIPLALPRVTRRQVAMILLLAVIVIGSVVYLGMRMMGGGKAKAPAKTVSSMAAKARQQTPMPPAQPPAIEQPAVQAPGSQPPATQPPATAQTGLEPPAQQPPAMESSAQPATPPPAAVVGKVPYFIDFASSPMPAEVTFQGENIGTTPQRINVQLEQGKTYQAEALFVMKDMDEQYSQKADFTTELDKSVIPVLFRAPIGILKVKNIPRDVELYFEANLVYDKFKSRTSKPEEIVMDKPIYAPFGKYILELRRERKLGETSTTYVKDIIYRREFSLEEDSPTFTLDVTDEDLKIFPVKVRSEPGGADVFIDGKQVGKTPYEGMFPLGEHRLVLRKEGYFEHGEDLSVDINTPFTANVQLKTSIAGAHINNARLAMNRQLWQEAINELAQALSSDPAPSEVALANYLLGKAYFNLNDLQRAIGYFEQARQSEDQRYPAMLGLVNCYAVQQQMNKALPLLIEVMLKAKADEVKQEANGLFQKISPFRSVIYVYSDPQGADVIVNDKKVEQKTPVILHDLPLGTYKLRIEKAGFLPTDLNLTLSVNEFNPVIVKLKPIPE
jgi:pSer/pThr/pTyr-binding forkhead associated (FHA) protein